MKRFFLLLLRYIQSQEKKVKSLAGYYKDNKRNIDFYLRNLNHLMRMVPK